MNNMDMDDEFYKILKYVLYGCHLTLSYRDTKAYLNDGRRMKEVDYLKAKELTMGVLVECDSGNWQTNEKHYCRTENWEEHLNNLKISKPHLFRKEKISKINEL